MPGPNSRELALTSASFGGAGLERSLLSARACCSPAGRRASSLRRRNWETCDWFDCQATHSIFCRNVSNRQSQTPRRHGSQPQNARVKLSKVALQSRHLGFLEPRSPLRHDLCIDSSSLMPPSQRCTIQACNRAWRVWSPRRIPLYPWQVLVAASCPPQLVLILEPKLALAPLRLDPLSSS